LKGEIVQYGYLGHFFNKKGLATVFFYGQLLLLGHHNLFSQVQEFGDFTSFFLVANVTTEDI
jgi:hypothetical protein